MKDNKLSLLQEKILKFNKERNWTGYHSPKNVAMSVGIEAGELMEIFQWYTVEESKSITDPKIIEHIGEELADVMIYCMNIATHFNLDYKDIIEDKIKKNAIKYPVK